MDSYEFSDRPERRRFELRKGDSAAYLDYEPRGTGTVALTHTVVPPELRGGGVAAELVGRAFGELEARGLRIVAECSYVVRYLERHPEWRRIEA